MQISQDFFAFAREASASARAAGLASLICDYLHMELTDAETAEVESILTIMLDDASPLVRRAIAEGLAREPRAPRHIIHALAAEQSEIAAIVLQHSDLFLEAELGDLALTAPVGAQMAIARRADVSASVALALAETGAPCVLIELARNSQADLAEDVMLRMMERAGSDGRLREALLLRPETPRSVRLLIAEAVSLALGEFVKQTGWLAPERGERVLRDAREKLIVSMNAQDAGEEQGGAAGAALSLVRHLRAQGQLTPGLLLRSLVCGDRLMLAAAMADLTKQSLPRVMLILDDPDATSFAALYGRSQLPDGLRPVFRTLLNALAGSSSTPGDAPQPRLVALARKAAEDLPDDQRQRLLVLLGRLEMESARAASRQWAARHEPEADDSPMLPPLSPVFG